MAASLSRLGNTGRAQPLVRQTAYQGVEPMPGSGVRSTQADFARSTCYSGSVLRAAQDASNCEELLSRPASIA